MGIRFQCPQGHIINVKDFLAGKKGVCPDCGAKVLIPLESTHRKDGTPIAKTEAAAAPAPAPAGIPAVPTNVPAPAAAPIVPAVQSPVITAAGGTPLVPAGVPVGAAAPVAVAAVPLGAGVMPVKAAAVAGLTCRGTEDLTGNLTEPFELFPVFMPEF